MGLFNKNDGGIMDVIRCDEPEYLIWKWHPQGSGSSSKKANSIRWGSSLRVKEGSVAAFVYSNEGGDIDYIEGPCDKVIETANFPVLANLVGTLYNGASPFQAEIYFINLAGLIQIDFGVGDFKLSQSKYKNFEVGAKVRGTINFRITDYREFVRIHRLDSFDMAMFRKQTKSAIERYVKSTVAKIPDEYDIPITQMDRQISEVSDILKDKLQTPMHDEYGVTITSVDLSAIDLDRDDPNFKKLEKMTQGGATRLIHTLANAGETLGSHMAEAKKKKETKDEGEGIGQKAAGVMENMFGKKNKVAPPPLPDSGYMISVDGKQKGPYDLSSLLKLKEKGKINAETLIWKDGMEKWIKSSEVDEVKHIFK